MCEQKSNSIKTSQILTLEEARNRPRQEYVRIGIISLDDVLPYISFLNTAKRNAPKKIYCGCEIKMNSQRYQVFKTHGVKCVTCGIEGKFFAIEADYINAQKGIYHLNLYAYDEQGREVLMTKDHIIAKANAGPNSLDNYQTMCTDCNFLKGIN